MMKLYSFGPCLIILLSTSVVAQPSGPTQGRSLPLTGKSVLGIGVEPGPYRKYQLIGRPVIQEGIKFTAAQKAKWMKDQENLKPLEDALLKYHEYRRRPIDERDPEVLATLEEEFNATQKIYLDQKDAMLVKVLERWQNVRLDQIQIQAQGPVAFKREDIQKRLNLAEEQIESILQSIDQGYTAMRNASVVARTVLPPDGDGITAEQRREHLEAKDNKGSLEKSREAVIKERSKTMLEITKVLTKKQRVTYQAMLGEPFDFVKPKPTSEQKDQSQPTRHTTPSAKS